MISPRRGNETRTAIGGHLMSKGILLAHETTVLVLFVGKLGFGFVVHSDRLVSCPRNSMYFVAIKTGRPFWHTRPACSSTGLCYFAPTGWKTLLL